MGEKLVPAFSTYLVATPRNLEVVHLPPAPMSYVLT